MCITSITKTYKRAINIYWDKVMSKAKIQGNFCDEVATQIKNKNYNLQRKCLILCVSQMKVTMNYYTNIKGLASEVSNISLLNFVFHIGQYYRMNTVFLYALFNITGWTQYFFMLFLTQNCYHSSYTNSQLQLLTINRQRWKLAYAWGVRVMIYISHIQWSRL